MLNKCSFCSTRLVAFGLAVGLSGLLQLSVLTTKGNAQQPAAEALASVDSSDWPWWQGANVDGASTSQDIPTSWSADQNVLWKADVPGSGHSSPIVIDGKVFLTTAVSQGQIQSLVSFDLNTGKQLWSTPLHQGEFAKIHGDNTNASATPASDGKYVYTAFGNKNGLFLSAIDMNGKLAWSTKTGPYPSEHGFGSSVCLHDNLVIVAGEALRTGFVGAFDKTTGEEVWNVPRNPDRQHANYATPVVVELAGRPQLLLGGWGLVSSYDPSTGALIWENAGPADVNGNSIAVQDPYVVVSGGYPQKGIICIKADEPEGEHSRKIVWESTRNVAWIPTPLIHDDRVMFLSDSGVVSDRDLKTGEFIWTERLSGSAYASPIRVGDFFLAPTRDGNITVFKSSDKFEQVAVNHLGDGGGNATPTVINNKVLIRTDHSLFCIGKP